MLITLSEITAMSTTSHDPNIVKAMKQSKRDLSLSYAATNIDSKEGTRVKTITVIKNIGNKKHEKFAVNPELHKNENWAKHFRDNFDSYGIIPDVPDIDDLFEFMNKKKVLADDSPLNGSNVSNKDPVNKEIEKPEEKPVKEAMEELLEQDDKINKTEKIEGDAEVLPQSSQRFVSNTNHHRSESLPSSSNTKQRLIDVNYSTPHHTVRQYFENYIQLPSQKTIGYDYPKPCNNPPNSINIATPGGRTYDIPANNRNNTFPYLAPAVTRKPIQPNQQQLPLLPQTQSTQQFPATISIQFPQQLIAPTNISNNLNRAPFTVNSIIGPLEPQAPAQQANLQPQQQAQLPATTSNITPPVLNSINPINNNFINNNVNNNNNDINNNNNNNQGNNINQGPFQGANQQHPPFSTSQRPYVAPGIRQGLPLGRGQSPYAMALTRTRSNSYRPAGLYPYGPGRSIFSRSRGLKY